MGFAGSYGLFEGYYTNPASPFPNLTSSIWAWPGGLQISLMCLLGGVSGRLFDAGYYRQVIMFGFFMQLLGVFTSSFAQSYVPILLSQGLCQGIGNGFVLCPTMSLLSTYFAKRRVTAISLVASGSASGGVVFPLISQHLLPKVGFGWTVRIMGFVMLANVAIILSLARKRIDGRRSGPWVELAAFKEPPYTLFICGMFCIFLALYFAFTYVSECNPRKKLADWRIGQSIRQKCFGNIDRNQSHDSPFTERHWSSRAGASSNHRRFISRAYEHSHSIGTHPCSHVLRLDIHHLAHIPISVRHIFRVCRRIRPRPLHGKCHIAH